MRDPRATVAIILAMSVLIFVFSGVTLRVIGSLWGAPTVPIDPELAVKWENIVSVIVGVLAGYVMGRNEPHDGPQ